MSHFNRYRLILCLLAMTLFSCTKVLEIDEPTNRQLVLNAELKAGERAFVNFSYTRFFLDNNNDQPVPGANVKLTVNGTVYTSDSLSKCNYFFPYTLQPGDSLGVDVTVPDGRTVHAKTYVPLMPDVDNFKVNYLSTAIFNYISATLDLSDHADVGEIYSIVVRVRDSGARFDEWAGALDTVDTIHTTYFCLPENPDITSNDVCPYIPLIAEPYMLYGARVMFLDNNISGRQNYPITILIPQLVDTNEREPFKHEYIIDVKSLTPAQFRYQLSLASQGSMTGFFAEQGQAYCNVDGALGIFAGTSGVKYTFCQDSVVGTDNRKIRGKVKNILPDSKKFVSLQSDLWDKIGPRISESNYKTNK